MRVEIALLQRLFQLRCSHLRARLDGPAKEIPEKDSIVLPFVSSHRKLRTSPGDLLLERRRQASPKFLPEHHALQLGIVSPSVEGRVVVWCGGVNPVIFWSVDAMRRVRPE